MKAETRSAVYDGALRLEAYRFQGMVQPFPNHFHAYYVLGLLEDGERELRCKNRPYSAVPGDLLLFEPGDSHACAQRTGALSYRALNISREVMLDLAEELTGGRAVPGFLQNVISDEEAARSFRDLHRMILEGSDAFEREERLLLVSLLFRRYAQPSPRALPECREEVRQACAFMEEHCAERISLWEISRAAGLSRSALLRVFPAAKGVTPYLYLQNIRVGRAKKLLEQGVPTAEIALRTGFFDQSHLANALSRFLGLSPGAYREIFKERSPDRGAFK